MTNNNADFTETEKLHFVSIGPEESPLPAEKEEVTKVVRITKLLKYSLPTSATVVSGGGG